MVFVDAVSTLKTFVWVLNYVLRSRTCFLFILKANFPDPLMALAKTKVPKFPKLLNISDRNTLYTTSQNRLEDSIAPQNFMK